MYVRAGLHRGQPGSSGGSGYGVPALPHRPIVAYDERSGELFSEYCVGFPDRATRRPEPRLPDADDVLAKWMPLRAGSAS